MKPSLPIKPSSVPAHVADSGKIIMGAGMRLPTARIDALAREVAALRPQAAGD